MTKSAQPRKKRKFLYTAPLHTAAKFLHAHLSRELRAKLKKRSIRIHKGDAVKVMKGKYRGLAGKVTAVSRGLVNIEGAVVKKVGGTELPLSISASNLVITQIVERK
ncbi:50S ribosomal protein L24 [Candidatus Micrarchaeota archaeon]|nr:50S ribosomal protein L24 [Candidatus Micrarchaeota archaeon]